MTTDHTPSGKHNAQHSDPVADAQLDRLISEALREADSQFALSHNFAEAIAAKSMPQQAAAPVPARGKALLVLSAIMASLTFLVACFALGIMDTLLSNLLPYKYFLALALLLLLGIQVLDVKLVKRKHGLL